MESVRYQPQHQPAIEQLLGAAPFKSLIWHWQFEVMSGATDFDPVVIEEQGKLIGFNGVMPVEVFYRGEPVSVLWSCDFYVDSAYRGQGVGRFIKQVLVNKAPLVMTFGVSDNAAQVLQRIGWSKAGNIHHFRYSRQKNRPRDLVIQCLQWFNRLKGLRHSAASADSVLEWSSCLPDAALVDRLWQQSEHSYTKVVRRHFRYLDWKYQSHPLASYRFLLAWRSKGKQLSGILVVREHRGVVRLVDWVGSATDRALVTAMVRDCFSTYHQARLFTATTTSGYAFAGALCDLGFFPARTRPSFYVTSQLADDSHPADDWFLMSGDSDGELLLAASENCSNGDQSGDKRKEAADITVVTLSEADFAALSRDWEHLLARSEADPLFMSWNWLFTWWQTWARELDLELVLLAAYDQTGVLQGLGPFFRHHHTTPVGISVRRLHLIGNAWRVQATVRTEYCGLIVDRHRESTVRAALHNALMSQAWDELVLCDLSETESDHWRQWVNQQKTLTRVPRIRDVGVYIDTRASFDHWLTGLGKNTRLKLYNRRTYLSELGQLRHQKSSPVLMESFLQQLNGFHQQRWGKPCFDQRAIEFHQSLVQRLEQDARHVVLSEIHFNGTCVAVQYDIRAGTAMYNIQAGFLESFDRKVALGTLHLGFLIEESFADPQIERYDLLAGLGKNTFYKGHLNGQESEFYTLQIARRPLLRLVYRYQAVLPRALRKLLNRIFRL